MTVAGTALQGRTFAAVLFDMDGTLLSSIAAVERAWTTLAHELSIPGERFGDFHGMPARDLLEALMPDRSAQERREALDRVGALELADVDGIEVLPGAAEALRLLSPGLCAIVTSSTTALAAVRLRAAGLPTPDVVVTVDDVVVGKPDPAPFLLAAKRLGVDPAHCLVVEDATAGIAAGRAAGSATLALTTTYPAGLITGDLVVPDLASVQFSAVEGGVRVDVR